MADWAYKRGDNAVALPGGLFVRAANGVGKRREQEQSAFRQCLSEFWRHSLRQAARGAGDDGVRTAQEDAEAFPLHRGMKPANNRHPGGAQFLCEVVSL